MSLCAACGSDAGEIARFCPSCGATVHRASQGGDPLIGRIIAGKFRIEALLGEGGMGMVYKATQVNLDKTVVLKVLRPALASDDRTVQRFQREARAASRLNHPNSIGIIDFGESKGDGSMYIAMEYCPGHDLHHILSHQWPLEEPRIIRIITQVLSALAEAHAHGVIHRDLKPENIMVEQRRGEPDFVKVLDFGIAKITDTTGEEGQALTRAGFVCGTPEYMSPEQARGAQIDHRSDLYAVGVILYQLITGLLPFDSESAVGFATAHLTQEVPPIRRRRPEARCSPALERLIMRALSKDPNQRPQTADIFREELLALAPGAPAETETQAMSAPERTAAGQEPWSDQTPADSNQATVVRPAPQRPERADRLEQTEKVSSRGRMPSARSGQRTALDPSSASGLAGATGTNTSPITRPDADGFGGAAKLAMALAGVGLLGASGYFAYEFFLKRPQVVVVDAPVAAPVQPVGTTGEPAQVEHAERKPPEPQPSHPAGGTSASSGGPELKLTAMAAEDPQKVAHARELLVQARRELAENRTQSALGLAAQAYDEDPSSVPVARTYADIASFIATTANSAEKRKIALDVYQKLLERSDLTDTDRKMIASRLKRLGDQR